jgi:hypothetical protein
MKLPIIVLAALLSTCAPAHAQTMCADHDALRNTFNQQGIRLEGSGDISVGSTELWVAPNGEWALIVINDSGVACMMASGTDWITPERL